MVQADKAVLEKIQQRSVALQTFKILRGFDRVNSETWFQKGRYLSQSDKKCCGPTKPEAAVSKN
jgi:hypothetical protein